MRYLLAASLLLSCSLAYATEPDLTFKSEGPGNYSFDTGQIHGKLRLDGRSNGISRLIHSDSGQEITYGGESLAVLSHYRIFTTGARYGDAARNWPTQSKLLADGSVEAVFEPAEDYPFSMKAVFRIGTADALDVETIVTAKKDLPKFEVFLSNYLGAGYDASVYVIHSLRSPGEPFFLPADHNPLVSGNYLLFPRDRESVLTVFDGRWMQQPHPVEWCITRYLAAPLAIRRHNETGLTAVLMAPAADAFAVSTPYNKTPPDGVAGHRSLYLSLFGDDIPAGKTASAHSRLQILDKPTDADVVEAFNEYTTN